MSETYYKVLDAKGKAMHGGTGAWALPEGRKYGAWMPNRTPVLCESGYHACRKGDLIAWLGPRIFVVEGRGTMLAGDDKVVFAEARLIREFKTWTDRTARLFACDCATRALDREKKAGRVVDPRSYESIRVARLFADGLATPQELAAARAAAWDAAGAAARAAARDAAWDAAWDAARAAAWDAAGDAARDAAGDAAWAAAWAAELEWQTRRLFEYLDGKRG